MECLLLFHIFLHEMVTFLTITLILFHFFYFVKVTQRGVVVCYGAGLHKGITPSSLSLFLSLSLALAVVLM